MTILQDFLISLEAIDDKVRLIQQQQELQSQILSFAMDEDRIENRQHYLDMLSSLITLESASCEEIRTAMAGVFKAFGIEDQHRNASAQDGYNYLEGINILQEMELDTCPH